MEQIKAFIEKAKVDKELMTKLDALGKKGADAEEVIALAGEYGFTVTKEDVEAARRQNCPHQVELSEEDLAAISGGATQNRYDAKVCHSLTEARYECVGFLERCWCDHYRRTETGKDNNYYYHEHSCAMGCFKYKTQKHRNLGAPY